MSRRAVLFLALALAVVAAIAFDRFAAAETPDGQPPLATIDGAVMERLRSDFNAAAEGARIVLLLSPT